MASNTNNLGYKVTTRQVSYDQLVREQWGTEWGMRDIVYEPTASGPRLDTDSTKSGVYGIALVTGFMVEPIIYPDAYSTITAETGQKIGIDP